MHVSTECRSNQYEEILHNLLTCKLFLTNASDIYLIFKAQIAEKVQLRGKGWTHHTSNFSSNLSCSFYVKKKCIFLQIISYFKCFNSMWPIILKLLPILLFHGTLHIYFILSSRFLIDCKVNKPQWFHY